MSKVNVISCFPSDEDFIRTRKISESVILLFLAFSLQNAYMSVRVYMVRTIVYIICTWYIPPCTCCVHGKHDCVHNVYMVRTVWGTFLTQENGEKSGQKLNVADC